MAFLMWGQVNPISSRGVAISIVALWADGDRVRTGAAINDHNINRVISPIRYDPTQPNPTQPNSTQCNPNNHKNSDV